METLGRVASLAATRAPFPSKDSFTAPGSGFGVLRPSTFALLAAVVAQACQGLQNVPNEGK